MKTHKQIEICRKMGLANKGKNSSCWKLNGTEVFIKEGRCWVFLDNHSSSRRRIPRAWLIIEKYFRFPRKPEVVHHVDGNKTNDAITNLILFKNDSVHRRFHFFGDAGVKEDDIIFDGRTKK